jgi:hypothetical protein
MDATLAATELSKNKNATARHAISTALCGTNQLNGLKYR